MNRTLLTFAFATLLLLSQPPSALAASTLRFELFSSRVAENAGEVLLLVIRTGDGNTGCKGSFDPQIQKRVISKTQSPNVTDEDISSIDHSNNPRRHSLRPAIESDGRQPTIHQDHRTPNVFASGRFFGIRRRTTGN